MKFGLYPRLALAGIRKNKRLYVPYLLTCTGMVMMYYIIVFLQGNNMLRGMSGGTTAAVILGLGSWVVAIFACVFLFYTHSFLLRRRKKEFGLYNILGMGRRHLVRIEIWETLFVAIGTTAAGILCGIAFSKLAELGLVNLIRGSITYTFSVSASAIAMSLVIFGVIHLLLLLRAAVAVGRTSAIQLLQSEAAGEKPPRANWFLGLLGVILLGVAYYMAVTIKEPLMALALFFVAVVLVILATYLIMISGSVLLCRQLQKNTAYYYNPRHFVSVSSMAYRMKRNGAGLASVCILATMVLVMLSSTTSLYFGAEDSLMARYPWELMVEYRFERAQRTLSRRMSASFVMRSIPFWRSKAARRRMFRNGARWPSAAIWRAAAVILPVRTKAAVSIRPRAKSAISTLSRRRTTMPGPAKPWRCSRARRWSMIPGAPAIPTASWISATGCIMTSWGRRSHGNAAASPWILPPHWCWSFRT